MTPIKAVLNQLQKNSQDDYQSDHTNERYESLIRAYAITNANLNLCKHFLESIINVDFSKIGASGKLKVDIKEFLENLNNK